MNARRILIPLLAWAGAVMWTPSAASAAEPAPAFSVTPVPDGHAGQGRGYFRIEARPGQTVTDALVLTNLDDRALEFAFTGVDASTGPLGGATYAISGTQSVGVGSWIGIEGSPLRLAPGASSTVVLRIAVPANARSGTHLGGVAVAAPDAAASTSSAVGGVGANVRIGTRRVVAVEIAVPGPAEAALVVKGVTPAGRPGGVFLLVNLENTGQGLTTAAGSVEVAGLGFRQDFQVGTFVPGTSIAYPVRVADRVPDGRWPGRVELRYGSQVATWEGVIVVGPKVVAELERRKLTGEAPVPGRSPSRPWGPVAFAAFAAVGAGAAVAGSVGGVRARRRPN